MAENPPAYPPPGRYRGIGGGGFLVTCGDCEKVVEHQWGRSGPAGASAALRKIGWTLRGRTSAAKWFCAYCSLLTEREKGGNHGK